MTTQKTALILGATGGVGGATGRALVQRGWHVRALSRQTVTGTDLEWVRGDALDAKTVRRAGVGVDAVVHAVNPPGYRDWARLALPMLDNSIAAARAAGARLALPGTIYNYDPAARLVDEVAPQQPTTRKGAIRKEMEQRIESACGPEMRGLIVRAGDFFGPQAGNNWLSQGMISPGKPVASIVYPGARGVGHGWAYLPDVGKTFARLLDRDADLPAFARFHMRGHWDADGTAIVGAIRRAANPAAKQTAFPWLVLPLLAPFNTTMREMIEMKGFWRQPLELDNRALVALLGAEPHTPLDTAMRETLAGLGCIPAQ